MPLLRWVLVGSTVLCFALLVYARSADLVTNRFYFGGTPAALDLRHRIGLVVSSARAAEFIEREKLPGRNFQCLWGGRL